MAKKRILSWGIFILGILLCLCMVNAKSTYATEAAIRYRTHVQDYGTGEWCQNGESSGTTGESKRLEGIWIKVESDLSGNVEYQTHIQNIGWENSWTQNGEMSGTSGRSLRLEAIRIRLTGDLEKNYDVYYCVHAQNFGWMGWAKNGEDAGTAGYGYRLEAIRIQLVAKGGNAPGPTENAFRQPLVSYQTHVQNIGWQEWRSDGAVAGTSGQSKRLEAICIKLNQGSGIQYRTHIQNKGWENGWKRSGQMSGTSGKSLRLEAIQIELTGDMAEQYDVYYRVHAQNFGWMGWAKNGESAGTEGYAYRLEAIQIQLVPKYGNAPGSTDNAFRKTNFNAAKGAYRTIVNKARIDNGKDAASRGRYALFDIDGDDTPELIIEDWVVYHYYENIKSTIEIYGYRNGKAKEIDISEVRNGFKLYGSNSSTEGNLIFVEPEKKEIVVTKYSYISSDDYIDKELIFAGSGQWRNNYPVPLYSLTNTKPLN